MRCWIPWMSILSWMPESRCWRCTTLYILICVNMEIAGVNPCPIHWLVLFTYTYPGHLYLMLFAVSVCAVLRMVAYLWYLLISIYADYCRGTGQLEKPCRCLILWDWPNISFAMAITNRKLGGKTRAWWEDLTWLMVILSQDRKTLRWARCTVWVLCKSMQITTQHCFNLWENR